MAGRQRRSSPTLRITWAVLAALLALAPVSACSRNKVDDSFYERPEPIQVFIKNENFLDMNVYAAVGGAQRRLGMVPGNSTGTFVIDWLATAGQSVTVTAVPIGGRGRASTGAMNVGAGQMIEFRVAGILGQSVVSIREP